MVSHSDYKRICKLHRQTAKQDSHISHSSVEYLQAGRNSPSADCFHSALEAKGV